MENCAGYIYILTNPSFTEYVKIGYADDVEARVRQLNNSECTPFAFRVYATYEVEERLRDIKVHTLIDRLNPDLRAIDTIGGKKRVREFYAMTPEHAYSILETIAILGGRRERLKLWDVSEEERKDVQMAQEIEEEHVEKLSPFAFSKCNIVPGARITFICRGNEHSGTECVVVDDKNVEYQGERYTLSGLATKLTGSKHTVAGPTYFKYNGEWVWKIRARLEGRQVSNRLDNTWVIPCNPKMYNIYDAFDHLSVIEWSQTNNVAVGDIIYIYVGGETKAILYKCEVIAADLKGNRTEEDAKYCKGLPPDPDGRYMRIKLLEKYPPDKYPLAELRENGLTNVQGRSKITFELMEYLEK